MAFCETFAAIATGYDFPEPPPFRESRHHIERKQQRRMQVRNWAKEVRRKRHNKLAISRRRPRYDSCGTDY